jgi:aryl-alcohol dehydrogenase-like predicted oxidoreductase
VEAGEPEAHRQRDRFAEAGGTLVDTANTYGAGTSEEIIGRWFASRPAEATGRVVLAAEPCGRKALSSSGPA